MPDDLMLQIARTLAQIDRRLARLEVGESSAGTASMSASSILAALLTVDGTASLLDADKLDGLDSLAFSGTAHTHTAYVGTASYTAADVLAKLLTVDGTASLLDADKLDGLEGASYAGIAHTHSGLITTGTIRMPDAAGFEMRDFTYNRIVMTVDDQTANVTIGGTAHGADKLGTITAYGGLDIKQGGTFGSAISVAGTAVSLDGHAHAAYAGTADVLRRDGSLPLTGAWDAGAFDVTIGSALIVGGTANITGATSVGSLNVGGSALIVPAAGTAALRNVANTFTATQRVPKLEIDNANNYIDTDAAGALGFKATSVVVANAAFLTLGNIHGLLFVIDVSSGNVALFNLKGAYNATQEILDVSNRFSVTKDTATSINIYWDASGIYVLQNSIGSSRTLTLYEMLG